MKKDRSSNFILTILIIILIYFTFYYNKEEVYYESNGTNYGSNAVVDVYNNYPSNSYFVGENTDDINNLNLFYYNQLSDSEKQIYSAIANNLSNYTGKIKLNKVPLEELTIAAYAVTNDHPEFYWSSKYTYLLTSANRVVEIEYDIPYDAEEKLKQVDLIANQVIENMNAQNFKNDYSKLKYFYDWIIDYSDYGFSEESQEMTSVFIDKTSVCAGYSKAFLYLCQKSGIECAFVAGFTLDNETHAWNLVGINNQKYWIDVTWGDPIYIGENDNDVNYNYFLVDDAELFKTHVIDYKIEMASGGYITKMFSYPICSDDSFNYYKLNNCYFYDYDLVAIKKFFKDKFKNNIYRNIDIKFREKWQYEKFLDEYLLRDDAYIYEDIKSVKPYFYGTMSISYSTIESANYAKISVELN